jgi:hypothetical protein
MDSKADDGIATKGNIKTFADLGTSGPSFAGYMALGSEPQTSAPYCLSGTGYNLTSNQPLCNLAVKFQ